MEMDNKDDKILLASVEDKLRQCEEQYMPVHTVFLDMRQQTLVEGLCRSRRGCRFGFYGGFADAERRVLLLLPDYMEVPAAEGMDEALPQYFRERPEYDPLTVIRAAVKPGGRPLTHRDYLGSLMGLGLKREMIGDLLVGENGADIVLLSEMKDYLLLHYGKAGRQSLTLEEVPLAELRIPAQRVREKRDTVASLRLDGLVASAFGLSRGKAGEAIRSGLVFVNGRQTVKTDVQLSQGDKMVLRGRGKAVLREVGDRTRKERIFIVLDHYL